MISYAFRRAVGLIVQRMFALPVTQAFGDAAAVGTSGLVAQSDHKHGIPSVTAPNNIVSNDGGGTLTTSGTTELTIISKVITNPSVAGQILVIAQFQMYGGVVGVAGDLFQHVLYFAGNIICQGIQRVASTDDRQFITLAGIAPVATSGSQQIKMTVQRVGAGSGAMNYESGRQSLSWLVIPTAITIA